MSQDYQRVADFNDSDDRTDAMHSTIDEWLETLALLADEARASDHLQAWLDVQSRFHDYSFRNSVLISRQCPDATHVAGYRTCRRNSIAGCWRANRRSESGRW